MENGFSEQSIMTTRSTISVDSGPVKLAEAVNIGALDAALCVVAAVFPKGLEAG
jgi:hypothetical protein